MIHEDVDGDDEGKDNMFEHIQDIKDPDEQRCAGRQTKFDQMKEGLIAKKETYIKTVKPSTAIEVGAPVVTKKKYNSKWKEGVVLCKVFQDDGKNYKWEVRLGFGQDEELLVLKSQQLGRKNANDGVKTYEWTVVEDHYAPKQPVEHKYVGVVGEKFPDLSLFIEMLDCTSQSYNHPFAQIFVFFWVGSWEYNGRK